MTGPADEQPTNTPAVETVIDRQARDSGKRVSGARRRRARGES